MIFILRNSLKNIARINNHNLLFFQSIKSLSTDRKVNNNNNYNNMNDLKIDEIKIPLAWGHISGQIFKNKSLGNISQATPLLCLHGYLDNSNSFKPLASFLCKSKDYYLIALDLPGHGFSSPLPHGVPYTPKLFLHSVRRCVRHLNLKDFVFMCHSYGITISFLYNTVFPDEAKANIALDWIFSSPATLKENFAKFWNEGIEKYIDLELEEEKENLEVKKSHEKERKELTMDRAVKILLRSNKHLDDQSARIMLERALIKNKNNQLDFSRDLKAKVTMSLRDHYTELLLLVDEMKKTFKIPALVLHVNPPSYGEKATQFTIEFVNEMRSKSNNDQILMRQLEGTHHVHMIRPKEVSEIVFEFLDKLNLKYQNSKL
jgi:pimeloyl-ACP methyl ester carboxylesterase